MTNIIQKSVFFNASASAVWGFLTDKDKLGTWYFPATEDLSDGANYELYAPNDDGSKKIMVWGKVTSWKPHSELVTTFTFAPLGGKETFVRWHLIETLGGTKLTLTHEGIAAAAGDGALSLTMALDGGWDKHFTKLREGLAA